MELMTLEEYIANLQLVTACVHTEHCTIEKCGDCKYNFDPKKLPSYENDLEWLQELKTLREKNTPKKPSTFRKIRKYDGYDAGDCPSCGTPNDSVYHNVTYCWACGQRLDWRAEE